MYSLFWFIVFAVLILAEMATVTLTTIWFALGAFAALLVAIAGFNIYIQSVVFIIVSVLLLCVTRPLVKRFINSKVKKTNLDSLLGGKARVTEEICNDLEQGKVIHEGQDWTARSVSDEDKIEVGTMVEIKSISGVKLIVNRL